MKSNKVNMFYFLRRFLMSSDRSKQEYSCPFCNESPRTLDHMRTHLKICGSKTDQCPNCKKYIVRSILAYHIDNNCTNPDLFYEVSVEEFKTGE